jgi:hypothetical protein
MAARSAQHREADRAGRHDDAQPARRPDRCDRGGRKVFDSMHESMRQGFGGTFDQLAGYLAKD